MRPSEKPKGDPKGRGHDGRVTVGPQDELENGRLQVGSVTICEIALEVAQSVLVQQIVLVLGVYPAVEDEGFCC